MDRAVIKNVSSIVAAKKYLPDFYKNLLQEKMEFAKAQKNFCSHFLDEINTKGINHVLQKFLNDPQSLKALLENSLSLGKDVELFVLQESIDTDYFNTTKPQDLKINPN